MVHFVDTPGTIRKMERNSIIPVESRFDVRNFNRTMLETVRIW